MTRDQKDMLSELRNEGHAVVVFTPDELQEVPASEMEDLLISRGWDYIDWYTKQSA